MKTILQDKTKFKILQDAISNKIYRLEDRINKFLRKLKAKSIISEDSYKKLYASGCAPGILYGLPKVHKIGNPLRPIFSAINTPSYNLCKFLVPILEPLTSNPYTLRNSYEFADLIKEQNFSDCTMASFDIESLFTNIPLHETIDIIIRKLFNNSNNFMGFTEEYFRKLLVLAVTGSVFLFKGVLYEQLEGLGMGLPLGPTFANIFLCFFEQIWLNECPEEFKPIFYKRYLDDTFIVFRSLNHIDKFREYLNSKHKNIKFTAEVEQENKINFLDITVHKN